MKKFLKENFKFILFIIMMILIVEIELPYAIEAPGGTLNLSQKIDKNYNKKNGSLNMLYVTEYKGNIVTVLLSKIIPTWDLHKINNDNLIKESSTDIYNRNKIMLQNSIDNATYVAYTKAGKKIDIVEKENIIIAKIKDNGLEIGDNILSIDGIIVENINTIKEHLNELDVGDIVNIKIKRKDKEKTISIALDKDKILGIMIITNYTFATDKDINIAFKSGVGGSSGGLILALGMYSELTGIDILKGRNVAGTGTIDFNGNIGQIDGIKYKIAGAVRNRMDLVLVSPYNYEEALKVVKENNYNIKIVKVSTFDEAVDYLTS